MALTSLPPRARCIHITGGIVPCRCPWFNAPTLPLLELNCVECGHGIHAHADYESKVVFHNPDTHCAAYAQKAHKSQACTCSIQLFDHEPIVNVYYRSITLPHGLAPFLNSLNSLPSVTANRASADATLAFGVNSTLIPSSASSDLDPMFFASATVPSHPNIISRFSQSDAYAFVSHSRQQLDDASVVHDLTGAPAVHRASEGYHGYQSHSTGVNGAPI
ncbi:hypothetical protein IW261DRAFT_1461871 [Armillaria novae-zelandiae]|uniref:Uncharacterized protein n=1 Tax=Armillaria novae-zelandiae TaxID=153914 RepID=A0AA39PFC7_9AGAR|nr:hypothetical protein IW261DRAFT_1461871 [Armillaria novae-zelandiae]